MRQLLILLLVVASDAAADGYENLDSLVVGNLVFFGATDRFEYSLEDTVRAKHWVVNNSSEPESIFATGHCWNSIGFHEEACFIREDTLDICAVPPGPFQFCVGVYGNPPFPVDFPPGLTVIEETTHPPPSPGWNVDFMNGEAHFWGLWANPMPDIQFFLPYTRRKAPTTLVDRSWSLVKELYR